MRSIAHSLPHRSFGQGSRGDRQILKELAWFRYNLRRFLRFSERAARACGVTPQQHQLMLGVAGFTGTGAATVSDLAEFLQERNNSVVGLVERAVKTGLVRRESNQWDRRQVVVSLTPRGAEILSRLTLLHHQELTRLRAGFVMSGRFGGKLPQPVLRRAAAEKKRQISGKGRFEKRKPRPHEQESSNGRVEVGLVSEK